MTAIVTATGTVNPVISVQVGSQVSGKVAQLFADFNSKVTKGQVLAQIDQKSFKARLSQARAAVKSAKGNLAKANVSATQRKREFDRMAALRPQAFVSQADVDLAETNYRDAAANVEVLQAQLDQAQAAFASAELDRLTPRSTTGGRHVVSGGCRSNRPQPSRHRSFVIAQDLTECRSTRASVNPHRRRQGRTEANFRVTPIGQFFGVVTGAQRPISIQTSHLE